MSVYNLNVNTFPILSHILRFQVSVNSSSTMARVCFFLAVCILFFGAYANSSLIQGRNEGPVFPKEFPLPKDDTVETNILGDQLKDSNTIQTPEITTTEKCAEIGEYCTYHSDCCTNACLGFMRRCVSNQG